MTALISASIPFSLGYCFFVCWTLDRGKDSSSQDPQYWVTRTGGPRAHTWAADGHRQAHSGAPGTAHRPHADTSPLSGWPEGFAQRRMAEVAQVCCRLVNPVQRAYWMHQAHSQIWGTSSGMPVYIQDIQKVQRVLSRHMLSGSRATQP